MLRLPRCTHLGCLASWNRVGNKFVCLWLLMLQGRSRFSGVPEALTRTPRFSGPNSEPFSLNTTPWILRPSL